MSTPKKYSEYDAVTKFLCGFFVIIAAFPLRLFQGLVASKLWFWFIVPFGMQPIGAALFAGILLLKDFLLLKYKESEEDKNPLNSTIFYAMVYTLILSVGYFLHHMMK